MDKTIMLDEFNRVSKNAFQEGYAQGLEAAANTVRDAAAGMPISAVVLVLANEAKRVREMGGNNESTE